MISREAVPARVHGFIYDSTQLKEQAITLQDSLETLRWPNSVFWVDVQGLGDEAVLRHIAQVFSLHPLLLEDVVHANQRPKAEVFDEYTFVTLPMMIRRNEHAIDHEQFSLVLGTDFVLTFQETYGDVFDSVRHRLRQGGPIFRSSGAEYLAYALIDAVIDGYFPVLEMYSDQLQEIEDDILTHPGPAALQRLHLLKRELLTVRRSLWPMREMISSLLKDVSPHFSRNVQVHLRDCYDHVLQALDMLQTQRELASSLMDLYLSNIANRQNDVMKTLTVLASIFIPLTFLTGLYGMNFEYMPELDIRWAYPALLAIMLVIGLAMTYWFYLKGWLGNRQEQEDDPPASH